MDVRLNEYNSRRNFDKSPEPEGAVNQSVKELKFVVQHHLATRDHYDFRLEYKGALLSWAVPKGPSFNPTEKRLAVRVEDHPLDYRNFEGTIPKGEYGGGTVMIWDEGSWEPLYNADEGLINGQLKFKLNGKRLKGNWSLVRLKAKEYDKDNWLLIKEKDDYALDKDGISLFTTSIRTGRAMKEIEEGKEVYNVKNPFEFTSVQLSKLVNEIPSGDDWLFELKYDGYRIIAYIEDNSVKLISRNGKDYTKYFSAVKESLIALSNGRAMILDGEMAVTDESGKTDFQKMQNYIRTSSGNLIYFVFDILALDGADLRGQTLSERKEALEFLMKNAPARLHYSRHSVGRGKESFAAACEAGMEGIIGKRASSVYGGTRNGDWIKLKCDNRQEFVVGGYTLTGKKTSGVSALILGVYDKSGLVYVGRAGTGLTESDMKALEAKFKPRIVSSSPFIKPPKKRADEEIFWIEPDFVAEIKFADWTKENLLRQASFKGLRSDKNPRDIIRETATALPEPDEPEPKEPEPDKGMIEGVKITSPDKVIFAEQNILKADVVMYYEKVAERMLPYIRRRILSIVRCPKGVGENCFYKKHPGQGSRGIVTIELDSDGKKQEYFYIEDKYGLISEAQMGTLEFHTWSSAADKLEMPDIMVFDLDPDEGIDLSGIRRGVTDLESILKELSLKAYLKTSGGKGYHVVVPFSPSASWESFSSFAKRIAQVMETRWPDRYTINIRKARRSNKIFIDWIRNTRGATSIAPYSIRARKGAKVSMPIGWDELNSFAPDGIDMSGALKRLSLEDPWKDFFINNPKLK
jgi:bifunctional non-homologous end joining protein LigD